MMKQTRPPTPEYLREHYKAWGHRYADRRSQDSNAAFYWPTIGGDKVNVLLTADLEHITQHHCAYCDRNDFGATIDHFRPKSRFPRLAFAWPNLFLCCNECQQAKATNFDNRLPEGTTFDKRLLKPDTQDYTFQRYFIVNFDTGIIDVNPAATDEEKERTEITIHVFELNKPRRKTARKLMIKLMFELMRRSEDLPLDDLPYRFLYD